MSGNQEELKNITANDNLNIGHWHFENFITLGIFSDSFIKYDR